MDPAARKQFQIGIFCLECLASTSCDYVPLFLVVVGSGYHQYGELAYTALTEFYFVGITEALPPIQTNTI
jgi:hypothetical protein